VKSVPAPRRGDLIWLDFSPQAGHEQAGRRPALVLSPEGYNRKTGLAIACPITHRAKGYPFEVPLPAGLAIAGVVLSDHVRNIDWRARRAEPAGKADEETFAEVMGKLSALLEAEE
jgi:mRNA interferase MazF